MARFCALAEGESQSGKQLFESKCVSCHGVDGQGTTGGYEQPLFGELSVQALGKLIERTMPEDDPEACVGDEANRIADYIHAEFYSKSARIKKGLSEPPRVELSRLTVQQHRNAIADVIGTFTPSRTSAIGNVEPGLTASYFQSKGMTKAADLKQKRIDYFVDYEFSRIWCCG